MNIYRATTRKNISPTETQDFQYIVVTEQISDVPKLINDGNELCYIEQLNLSSDQVRINVSN